MNPPHAFRKFDHVSVKLEGKTAWIDGQIFLASPNNLSLLVTLAEGIPVPFALLGSQQALALLWDGQTYNCVKTEHKNIQVRPWEPS